MGWRVRRASYGRRYLSWLKADGGGKEDLPGSRNNLRQRCGTFEKWQVVGVAGGWDVFRVVEAGESGRGQIIKGFEC